MKIKKPEFPKTKKVIRTTKTVAAFCINPLCLHSKRCGRKCCNG